MASDLERIAQGLLDYLEQNPRMSADLRQAAGECQELASLVGELAILLPGAAAAAEHLAAAAHACDEAAALSANATTIGRTWAIAAVGGSAGSSTSGTANRNPATTLNRDSREDRESSERDDRERELELDEVPEADEARERRDEPVELREFVPEQRDDQDDEDDRQLPLAPSPLPAPLPPAAPGDSADSGDGSGGEGSGGSDTASGDGERSGDGGAGDGSGSGSDLGEQPSSKDKKPTEDASKREPFNLDLKFGEGTDDEITAREILKRYDPAKANLPEMSLTEAVDYITANKEARPWLAPAADCEPEVQRVYATLDNGLGHAHHRHDGLGDDTLYERRVAYLEDPAQTNPTLRAKSEDAFAPGNLHYCGIEATRIADPRAFATAMARALEHPDIQAVLATEWDEDRRPLPAEVPIADLLGSDGHRHCVGFRLKGEWPASKRARKRWAMARASGADLSSIALPDAEPIDSFEGASLQIQFVQDFGAKKYQLKSAFVVSPGAEGN
ncbi:hypothetical protein [Kribbella deserti]|uniref:Uncharacterized protein n=1 Tax=Kribbella deserti TaxID=1926257 RepID=A0ABV6QIT5_9ACTN